MRTIPVDLILHELAARLAELPDTPDTQHRDLHRAISNGCIRPQTLAEEWTSGAGVAQKAAWLVRRLDGENMTTPRLREIAAETRAMEVAVARRLADCALSILVTQDAEDAATAQTLLQAAQRVVGLPAAKPGAEAGHLTSAMDSVGDGLSPATLRHYLTATRDALGLGSGPVFLGDIVTRAKSLTDADKARHAAEAENDNKASIIAKQEKTIANLKSAALVGVAGVIADALHLEAKPGDSDPATLSRRCVEAIERLQATAYARAKERDVEREEVAARGELLKRAHDDRDRFLANLRKALNMDEGLEGDVLTAIARLRDNLDRSNNAGEVSARAFKVGDVVRFARVHPESEPDGRPPLGWLGTITRIGDMTFPFKVEGQRYDGDLDVPCWWFAAESLDLVTPTA